jgi:hypothetical protein
MLDRKTKAALGLILVFCAGCSTGVHQVASRPPETADSGYCHKKLRPVSSTDPGRITDSDAYIDYSGPCDGPSAADQARRQRRFESFRFGRDYMDEG